MATLPLISIIIPTYNHGIFIGKTLESLISQTYNYWEAIIIDNNSVDCTESLVFKYLQKDSRFRYYKIENSGIIAKSRNYGINKSRGEWIAFLDSDDWWHSEKLEICTNVINKEVDLIYHYLKICSSIDKLFKPKSIKSRKMNSPIFFDLLVNSNPIINSSVLVRKSLLFQVGLLSEDVRIVGAEDYDTWLKIAKVTDKFICIQKELSFYRIHDFNNSNPIKKDMSIPDKIITNKYKCFINKKDVKIIKGRISYTKGRYLFIKKKYKKSIIFLKFSLRNNQYIEYKIKALMSIIFCYYYLILVN
jgi:glycosyltransferase involved in cell wall biosynthesis